MTKEWMMMTPRRKDSFGEIGVNSTGMVGLLLAKSQDEFEALKDLSPLKVLTEVGLARLVEEDQQWDY